MVIFDREGRGLGAELIHHGAADAYDPANILQFDVLIPVAIDASVMVELRLTVNGRAIITTQQQPVHRGENRLAITLPAAVLTDGENLIEVKVTAGPDEVVILNRTLRVIRESAQRSVARTLCAHIDWSRPELANSDAARAFQSNRMEEAALSFVRHLRSRATPHMGYTKEYVAKLREQATAQTRAQAAASIASMLGTAFLGGSYPDGRGTLLAVRADVLQVAGTVADFELFAKNLTANRHAWNKAAHHTSVNVLRFLQAAWPLEECSDESLVPVLAFLGVTHAAGWAAAKTWDDGSHGIAHNWWAYEFGGNWKASLLFPEFIGFAKFRALFPTNVERECRLLFFEDGFTREVSLAYHIGTVDIFYDTARLASLNGLKLSDAFHERLSAAAEVEWKLMQPDGNYPAFGDCFNDGPHVLERARSMAAVGGIPECKFLAESLDPNWKSPFGAMLIESLNYPSIGEDLRPAYDKLPAREPATFDIALVRSGYYVMRQNWTAQADYAAIEASPRGLIDSSHGHSAVFDLKLSARGRAILVGNGKGPDDHGSPPRLWRVTTAAHSAASVDGEEPAPLRSIYRFAREVMPFIIDWRSTPTHTYFHGVHEAYNRLANPVHAAHRKLFYLRGKYWILIDRFTAAPGAAPHVYRQHFQIGVPSRLEVDARCVTQGPGGNLLFLPASDCEALKSPCPFPLEGYPSTEQLVYAQSTRGHGLLATLLVPFVEDAVPRVSVKLLDVRCDDRVLSPHEATGLEIEFDGERHVYVDLHTHWNLPWECGGERGEEHLFHSGW